MPQLRKDPILGRWVIIATERAKRPDQFSQPKSQVEEEPACPFCPGKEKQTPPEICALRPSGSPANGPGWELRVVPSSNPLLRVEGELDRRGKGIYDIMNGIGAHEIIIESPQHIGNTADLSQQQIEKLIICYADRIRDLEKDVRLKYVLVFKNYGLDAGASRLSHARSQVIATPVNPKRVKEELVGCRQYYEYHERCVFCDIIRQESQSGERIILDDPEFIAVVPFAARFPFEVWIIPKKHSCDFMNIDAQATVALAAILKKTLLKLKNGLNDPSYNFVLHTAPFRRQKASYWKSVEQDYHWHIEIMPRLTKVAGFEWGTGFYICPVTPEDSAQFLREVAVEL